MKRTNPLLTPLGLSLTLFLFSGLGLSLWLRGGSAFSPGPLSAQARQGLAAFGFSSHASFETECARCHQPLETIQGELCLECHEDVAQQIRQESGLHARLEGVMRCFACHPDHRGRDFDPRQAALGMFDHSLAQFSLLRHQVDFDLAPMACAACHDFRGPGVSAVDQRCLDCHRQHDGAFMHEHQADFGTACQACHDGLDTLARFDHAASAFALTGQHASVSCAGCHHEGQFEETHTDCAGCHVEPDVHLGLFGLSCADCHQVEGWLPAVLDGKPFDHNNTAFSLKLHALDSQGEPILCQDCHAAGSSAADLGLCVTCHSHPDPTFIHAHRTQFGENCLDCHDGLDRMQNFTHDRFFVLDGSHQELDCQACHSNQVYAGTPADCAGCHAEPPIHAGFFGLHCQSCHTTQAWVPALLREHTFPLDHGEAGVQECRVCHPDNYVEYTCYTCHEHEPGEIRTEHLEEGISDTELPHCAECHPTGREEEGEGE